MATHIPTKSYIDMPPTMALASATQTVSSDWKTQLPVLQAKGITLRELRVSDASSLLALLTTEEVTRFISPPPTTVEGFERFIQWAQREREAGRYVCFAVVPERLRHGSGALSDSAVGSDVRDGRMGLCARFGILGLRPVRVRRGADD